jgi:flagellin-like protein
MSLRKEQKKYLWRHNKMNFEKNEEAVSPVIGVILMVAITVILAAVIAAFVFNLGGGQEKAPTASIVVANNPDTTAYDLKLSHKGGETLKGGDWKVSVVPIGSAPEYNTSVSGDDGEFGVGAMINVSTSTLSITTAINHSIILNGTPLSSGKYDVKFVHVPSNAMLLDTVVEVR